MTTHRPLVLKNITLSFPHKTCFEGFSAQIQYGQRIGIFGKNGSGKSSLLRLILELKEPTAIFGSVPQIINDLDQLSGGQKFNKSLSLAIAAHPNVLSLDEPTNHLDAKNRRSLLRMLENFLGTLIVVTHDVEVLRNCVDTLWHIDDERITMFEGRYDDYVIQLHKRRRSLEAKLDILTNEKNQAHDKLMRDQERAKKKRVHGEKKYDGDKLALRSAQGRGQRTTNKNRKKISDDKSDAENQLANLRIPDVIRPKFTLNAADTNSRKPVVSVLEGGFGYQHAIAKNLHLHMMPGERVLVSGDNGCGKTTLVKAIIGDKSVWREGSWLVPQAQEIGYLDQNYATLDQNTCAMKVIGECMPNWTMAQTRDFLNDFLFRKNEEVTMPVRHLSGGEKARLSLAIIAAKTPKLLILDEVTNNIDLDTREHVIQVLRGYPGAMLLISHDADFVKQIGIGETIDLDVR